jgi:CheY-like chemotaxis protein
LEFANSLLEPDRSEDERRAAINSIRCSGDHLLQIVDDIRDLSEIQAGRLEVEVTGCSPVDIVAEVASLIRRHSADRGPDLKLEYAGPIPKTIHSDPTRLRQILLNLLSSAVKFSRGGSLELRTEFLPRDTNESRLQFEIIDPGSGMCDQELTKLFRPYGQIDPSTTTGLGSAALGLTISNQLVECLGGDMSVAYSPAKGCRVRVSVPTGALDGVAFLDQPAETSVVGTEDRPFPECVGKLGECRILLAEDDPVMRKSISGLLTRAGAEVTIAETGPAAVGLAMAADAAGSPFDVVLMEAHLSVLDGDGAIKLLRERGYERPIVALSEPVAVERQERCGASGSDDVVVKPIDPSRFMAAIRAQLGKRAVPERAQPMPS